MSGSNVAAARVALQQCEERARCDREQTSATGPTEGEEGLVGAEG